MKWIPHNFPSFFLGSTTWAVASIRKALLFLFLLGFFSVCSSSANADTNTAALVASDVRDILDRVNWMMLNWDPATETTVHSILDYQSNLSYLSDLYDAVYDDSRSIYSRMTSLIKFLTGDDYLPAQIGDSRNRSLPILFEELEDVIRQQPAVVVTNIFNTTITNLVQVCGGSDALAANPWWATNSAFALINSRYSLVYPHEQPDNANSLSFPQFLSKWSTFLSQPYDVRTFQLTREQVQQRWATFWGFNRAPTYSSTSPYTWFDFMADATRSNWVAGSSLLSSVRASVTNDTSNAEYIVNHLDAGLDDITNYLARLVLASLDASNPWWYTNSTFSVYDHSVANLTPRPWHPLGGGIGLGDMYTFPQAYSFDISSRHRLQLPNRSLFESYGTYQRSPYNRLNMLDDYAFEDWVADAWHSNQIVFSQIFATTSDYRQVAIASNSIASIDSSGESSFDSQVASTQGYIEESIEEAPEYEPENGSITNPYRPVGNLISLKQSNFDQALPDFDSLHTEEVVYLFDGNSGIAAWDAVGPIRVNFREEMQGVANVAGPIFQWFWNILCSVLTAILLMRCMKEIAGSI